MSIYRQWGLSGDPFSVAPLPRSEHGSKLMVGRDDVIDQILLRLDTPNKLVAIEGPQGVGKTSVINVATHRKMVDVKHRGGLLLPCEGTFQLTSKSDPDVVLKEVQYAIALTIANYVKDNPNNADWFEGADELGKWLTEAAGQNVSASINLGFASVSMGNGNSKSTRGFEAVGFGSRLNSILERGWKRSGYGGVVCLLDNIELIESSSKAKHLLEVMRDTVFAIPRTYWIAAGSLGMVLASVASTRLSGYVFDPLQIGPVSGDPSHILRSRIEAFRIAGHEVNLPLSEGDFVDTYSRLKGNTRLLLGWAGEYCLWSAERRRTPRTEESRRSDFKEWRVARETQVLDAIGNRVGERAWKLFGAIFRNSGSTSLNDYLHYEFKSKTAMSAQVKQLQAVNLLEVEADEIDGRRKCIRFTDQAWLVASRHG